MSKKSAAAQSFEDEVPAEEAPAEPEPGTTDALQAGLDGLLDTVAAAEAADPRPKLAFVQFKVPARLNGRAAVVPIIARNKGTRLYIEDVAGVKCVVAEGPGFPKRGFAPMENVAAFGLMT